MLYFWNSNCLTLLLQIYKEHGFPTLTLMNLMSIFCFFLECKFQYLTFEVKQKRRTKNTNPIDFGAEKVVASRLTSQAQREAESIPAFPPMPMASHPCFVVFCINSLGFVKRVGSHSYHKKLGSTVDWVSTFKLYELNKI